MSVRRKIPTPRAAATSATTSAATVTTTMARQVPISLGGAFLPISGMEFRDVSKRKGEDLLKSGHLFNVIERQDPQEACVTLKVQCLRETSVTETPYAVKLVIDVQRKVVSAECTCVGGRGTGELFCQVVIHIYAESVLPTILF